MPLISSFHGIRIYVQNEKNTKHHVPHVHAKYNEFELVISCDGEILEGKFPIKQRKLIEAWVALYPDEIKAAWYAWNEDGDKIQIRGL